MHQIDFIIVIKHVFVQGQTIDFPKATTFENLLLFGVGMAA